MNLYIIEFKHYAPKDSEKGIKGYIVAENDDEVYEFIKSEPEMFGETIYNSYADKENDEDEDIDIYDDDNNVIGKETFKERIIGCHGDMNDEYSEVSDLYYGATQYGWTCVIKDIASQDVEGLRYLGILQN